MSLINIRALGVTLSTELFANFNLSIAAGDRIGLVAANGRGKSTLLKCITGAFEPTAGEITRARGLTVGHMEQNLPAGLERLTFREAVLGALSPEQQESESWRADVTLEELEVPEALRERPLAALSGGWQRIALV
ncbi:ATP-binding cassette domain-containing protein, partial [Shinella sp.]|uniref:ATP-binding cassette domain-containing protein n=1 Tax=Shinella sp. TaxID=1870904 RepID=UPI0039E3196A